LPWDGGQLWAWRRRLQLRSPADALRARIAAIYQDFHLVPHLTVAENMFLGREPRRRGGFVDWPRLRAPAEALLAQLGAGRSPTAPVSQLSVAGQQLVEIAKVLAVAARILVPDEPRAALTPHELEAPFAQVRQLNEQGVSIIYISRPLAGVFVVADRATALRNGRVVGTRPVAELDETPSVRMMVGWEVAEAPRNTAPPGQVLLSVEGGQQLRVRERLLIATASGEGGGAGGLVEAGRTELARAISGAAPRTGRVLVAGRLLRPGSPRPAIALGLGLAPEDRQLPGPILCMSVAENVTLPALAALTAAGWVRARAQQRVVQELAAQLHLRPPDPRRLALLLWGGNQQKVVLAK
jgi:ABC-type sugar transport system ATPase subunit